MRGGRKVVSAHAYPDMAEFWADITAAYRAEIHDLVAAGCRYLQFDDVSVAYLCDPEIRAQIKRDGEDPDALPALYAQVISDLIAERPESLTVTLHTCRGNFQSMWMASGGYDAVAETFFAAPRSTASSSNTTPSAPAASSRCASCPRASASCSA
ncbi:MAG: hypothetical protein WDO24_21110 [Pseudomonadota bacterium]